MSVLKLYDNFVLENKLEDKLTTHMDLHNFVTVDNSLVASPGMTKVVNTYTYNGNVEDVAMGVGNTGEIQATFSTASYVVGTTQGRFSYFDEQAMTDEKVIEAGINGISTEMTNDFTSKAIAEFQKASLSQAMPSTGIDFDTIVDAIAKLNTEDESGLFLLINPDEKADLRKNLADDLKYVEAYVRTGYIGSVCGVPVYVSKAVPAGEAYMATKEAVTVFTKKGSEVEQEREANIRKNWVYARKVCLVALTDATKVVKIA